MLRDLSPKKALWLSMAVVVLLLAFTGIKQLPNLLAADMPNPDSYTKLVLVRDWQPETGYQYMARDGAPDGSYLHWSVVHTWTLQQLARGLRLLGMTWESALLLAGGGLTVISVLLLYLFTCLAVISRGGRLATLATALVLLTSPGINAYGKWIQITHHIFMLVPIAAGAWLIFRNLHPVSTSTHKTSNNFTLKASSRAHFSFAMAGALLGLGLWISPETMPLVASFSAVAAANRLQFARLALPLFPLVAGLLSILFIAWVIDPPPPSFSPWALDHISLAWLAWAGILAALLLLTDVLAVNRQLSFTTKVGCILLAGLCGAGAWLWFTPGALNGPSGLLPNELVNLWWTTINELRSIKTPSEVLAWLAMPVIAGLVLLQKAWRSRCLWWATLALACLAYAVLTAMHMRSGAAAGLLCALCWGLWLSQKPAFYTYNPTKLPAKQQWRAVSLILIPELFLALALGTTFISIKHTDQLHKANTNCQLKDVQSYLNTLPPGTLLLALNAAPEALWLTHHRVIAGNYHHNTQGILDVLNALHSPNGATTQGILARRGVRYMLTCSLQADENTQRQNRLQPGDIVNWAQGPEKLGDWNLYYLAPKN